MRNLTTEGELADILGKTPAQIAALRRKNGWPHVFLGRFDRRYTEEQLEAIVAQMTRRSQPAPKVKPDPDAAPRPTARSAARHQRRA